MAEPDAIADLQQRHAEALRLGVLASPVLRVEPALLRALRQQLLPRADLSAELDLWFSDLVRTRSASAVAFAPAALSALRRRLAVDAHRHAAIALARRHLAKAHAYVRSDLELTALPMLDPAIDDAGLELHLTPLLDDLRAGGETAMNAARWLLQAAPRWHERVHATGAAWAAMQAASALLGGRTLLATGTPAKVDPAQLMSLGQRGELQDIGVLMSRQRLDFVPVGTAGAATVRVPKPWPSLTVLRLSDGAPQLVSALPGQTVTLPGVAEAILHNPDGSRWRLRPGSRSRAASTVTSGTRLQARVSKGLLRLRLLVEGDERPALDEAATDFESLLARGVDPDVDPARPQDRWPPAEETRFWAPLRALADTRWIVLEADPGIEGLPWESLLLPGREAWERRAIGLRLLRAGHAAGAAWRPTESSGPAAALLLLGTAGEPSPSKALREEGQRIGRRLQGRAGIEVQTASLGEGDDAARALQTRRWTVVHWSSDGAAPPFRGGNKLGSSAEASHVGHPLADLGRFEARDLHVLRTPPELVFLNIDHSGISAADGDQPNASDRPVDSLLALGVPIIVACGGRVSPAQKLHFATLFHDGLIDGSSLHEACFAARQRLARDGDAGGAAYQVWGDPLHRVSYAAGTRAAPELGGPIVEAVVPLADLGDVMLPITGVRLGAGVVVTARTSVGQMPFLVSGAAPRDQYQMDPPEGDNPVAVGLRQPSDEGELEPSMLALAEPSADNRFRAQALMMSAGLLAAFEVLCEAEPRLGEGVESSHRHFRVRSTRRGTNLPSRARGAALLVGGRLAGLVIGEDEADGSWLACGVEAVDEALQASQRRYLAKRLDEHESWLDSGGRQGRRLVADGARLGAYALPGRRLNMASLVATDLHRADLRKCVLDGADLRGADLSDARLDDASLVEALLDGADLSRTRLPKGFSLRPSDTPAELQVLLIHAQADGQAAFIRSLGRTLQGAGLTLRAQGPVSADADADADQPLEAGARAQEAADAVLVIWSARAAQSEWVADELAQLLERGLPFLTLRLDDTPLPPRLLDSMAVTLRRDGNVSQDATLRQSLQGLRLRAQARRHPA